MTRTLLILLAACALCGCSVGKPMTESEFLGFCYQDFDDRRGDCDTISVCDQYRTVMSKQFSSKADCLADCAATYAQQANRFVMTGCAGAAENARDWCDRFCRDSVAP
uniref:Lipoprotein n=1 Tax=Fundidesulfovibrio putealis TaxID=270496 RepID=A0A7C4AGH6_9BACT